MTFNKYLTIFVAKVASSAVKLLSKGQGTALPGLIAVKMNSKILKDYAKQIPEVIVITGTNGKTTTQQVVTSILRGSGKRVLANSSGSNMRRGLLSLFINKGNARGKLDYDCAVFEIEEATMPKVLADLSPNHIIVTNLYRDQLDAYGEVERTKKMIESAILKVKKARVYVNYDDPQLRDLIGSIPNLVTRYAISPEYLLDFKYEGKSEPKKESVDFLAEKIKINEDLGSKFKVAGITYGFNSPGIYNVYNALAAISLCSNLGLSTKIIQEGLLLTKIAFGRGEIIKKYGHTYRLLLTKNPAGLNLVLDLLKNVSNPNIILLLNDKIADGKDVSWIWDAEFEKLLDVKPASIIIGGSRAADLLLRLKYVYQDSVQLSEHEYILGEALRVYFEPKQKLLNKYLKQDDAPKHYFVIHTYTAMLEFRKLILGKAIED